MNSDRSREIADLTGLMRIPGYAGNAGAKQASAAYCVELLNEAGFDSIIAGPADAPAIIASIDGNGPGRLLFYNHYDVVPSGDAATWVRDPFVPQVEDGVLYGRGASDHKASFIARLAAVRNLRQRGELPVGVTFLVDGEEEIGSPSLEDIILSNRHRLRGNGGLYSGGARSEGGGMVIRAGAKGRCGLELSVTLGDRDNHSKWAAVLPSAAWRLVSALASFHDARSDKLLLDGFLDGVRGPDNADEEALGKLHFDTGEFLKGVGHSRLRHGAAADPLRALMFSPTFNLAWIKSGSGGGTVLPGAASAMLDIRLVPGQTPERIAALIRQHLTARGYDDIEISQSGGSDPDKCDLDDPVVLALRKACANFSDDVDVHPMGAGSGPRYLFKKHLGFSLVQDPGCSWQGSNDHASNENIMTEHFHQNRALIEAFLVNYGDIAGRRETLPEKIEGQA